MERGWSLSQLSQRVHYSKSYLSRVENGLRVMSLDLARRCDEAMATDGRLVRLARELPPAESPPPSGRPDGLTPASRGPVPAQLPAMGEMWGREGELSYAETFLSRQHGPAVIAVDGMAGVGKTTFAVSLAARLGASHGDGALFADLRAHGPRPDEASPHDLATGLLHALGLGARANALSMGPDERIALVRSALAERRVVMVLDDAARAAQVAPLLPATGDSVVVITSRRCLTALSVRHGALRVALEPLPPQEAVLLIRRTRALRGGGGTDKAQIVDPATAAAGAPAPAVHPAAARDDADATLATVARHCGYLPLALRIAAEHLAEWGDGFAAALGGEPGHATPRLDLLAIPGEGTGVRAVFDWSYRALPADQARAFRLLALHPGAVAGLDAVAALLGEPTPVTARLLGELRTANLVMEVRPGRFRMHDLLREYARERAGTEDGPRALAACTERMLAWYLHTVEAAADLVLGTGRHRVPIVDIPHGCRPLAFASLSQALRWYDDERANLLACCRQAGATNSPVAWQLPYALWPFLFLRHHHLDLLEAGELAGEAAAAAAAGPPAEACAETVLASARAGLRQHAAADSHYRRAAERFAAAGDPVGEGTVRLAYALSCMRQQRNDEAAVLVGRSLDLFTAQGGRWGTAMALLCVGEVHLAQGRPGQALAPLLQALQLHRAHGSVWLQASTLTLTATAHRELGDHRQAVRCYGRALVLHARTGMLAGTAQALHQLGISLATQGKTRAARRAWLRAAGIYRSLDDPRQHDVQACLTGDGAYGSACSGDRAYGSA
ncbi:tetratricopeptide repeat protein [Streptomyces sp. URMC 127]|uniref:tetratricopeptide repeat protein n=1 Tax=Streptomyces sp. URMC 127 TaxID=3423402 RepID=UPI003F1B8838